MAEKYLVKNVRTGKVQATYLGYSWTMFFFNLFPPLIRRDFVTFFRLIIPESFFFVLMIRERPLYFNSLLDNSFNSFEGGCILLIGYI